MDSRGFLRPKGGERSELVATDEVGKGTASDAFSALKKYLADKRNSQWNLSGIEMTEHDASSQALLTACAKAWGVPFDTTVAAINSGETTEEEDSVLFRSKRRSHRVPRAVKTTDAASNLVDDPEF